MFPIAAVAYIFTGGWMASKHSCNVAISHPLRLEPSNFTYLFSGHFCVRILFTSLRYYKSHLFSVPHILSVANVLKIAKPVIRLVAVYMVDFMPVGTGADKRTGNNLMNGRAHGATLPSQKENKIPAIVSVQGKKFKSSTAARNTNAFKSANAADFVDAFKANYRSPLFRFELLWSKFFTSHDLNLTDRLGLWSGPFAALNSLRAACILPQLALLILLFSPTIYAQEPPRTVADAIEQDELKSQQLLIAELKKLRAENLGLKDEVAAQKGTIAVQEKIIKIVEERGDFFKVAAEKGIKAGDNCGLIQERYDRMVAQYEQEEQRLRSENDKLRASRNNRAIWGTLAGAAGGYAFCSRGR
jgi:hypothetical protein